MSTSCGEHCNFDGVSDDYIRGLWIVIALNASMFVFEIVAGHIAKSQALQADALDFFGDTLTYGLSLVVIGKSVQLRTSAAFFKGVSLLLMGVWVIGSTIYRTLYLNVPSAEIMGGVGLLALTVNLICVFLLIRFKDGDANVRSVWLCSRNDAIGNIAVIVAALSVWGTATAWPDLIVAFIMAGLFLYSSVSIIRQAIDERSADRRH